jgi:hypothetical protein
LKEAWVGRKYGFDTYMCQNMASVASNSDVNTDGLVNQGVAPKGYPAGTKTLVVDGYTGSTSIPVGSWCTIDGDDTPQYVTAHTETVTNTTGITISPGLKTAVADNATITVYNPGAVNLSAGYATGWYDYIAVKNFSTMPAIGQFLTYGTSATQPEIYTVVDVSGSTILLDRPLESDWANSGILNPGPYGNYSLAFHKNAIALVVRPLAMPRTGTGALSAVANYKDLSMRATITYNGTKQGHLVTLDMLCGIAILDKHLGAVMLG